ncbi:hypothetical protein ACOWN4_05060 [Helicobacter pylori]
MAFKNTTKTPQKHHKNATKTLQKDGANNNAHAPQNATHHPHREKR